MSNKGIILLCFLYIISVFTADAISQSYIALYDQDITCSIVLDCSSPKSVDKAVKDLQNDFFESTGSLIPILNGTSQIDKDASYICVDILSERTRQRYSDISIDDISWLENRREASLIVSIQKHPDKNFGNIYILGSDERGTIYGIYEFCERILNANPLKFWTGYTPVKRDRILMASFVRRIDSPTFIHRGWMIENADLLKHWQLPESKEHYNDKIDPDIYEKIAEIMLRCRANIAVIGDDIDISNDYYRKIAKLFVSRGLNITQHLPLGLKRNDWNIYWKQNRAANSANRIFTYPIKKWAPYSKIWQIGLAHDIQALSHSGESRETYLPFLNRNHYNKDIVKIIEEQKKAIRRATSQKNDFYLILDSAEQWQENLAQLPKNCIYVFPDNHITHILESGFSDYIPNTFERSGIFIRISENFNIPSYFPSVSPHKLYEAVSAAEVKGCTDFIMISVENIRNCSMPLYILHNLWQNPNKYKSYDSILETWCKIHFGESWFFTMRLYDNYFDSFYKYKEDIHTRNEYVLSIEKCADIGLKLLDLMSSNNFDREDRQNLWQLLSDDLELYLTKHTQQSATGEIVREYLTSDLDNLVNRLLNGSKTGMETFQRYMAMDSSSITKIPKTYRNLFHDDILIPMQISANIYKWLSLICVAYNDIKENKYLESSKTLYWASNQIEACIENSANLEYDKWKDWLKGAKYFDLNKICQRTREISLKIEDLQIHQ